MGALDVLRNPDGHALSLINELDRYLLFDLELPIPPKLFAYLLLEQRQTTEQASILALFYLMKGSSDVVGGRFHRFLTNTHISDIGFVSLGRL